MISQWVVRFIVALYNLSIMVLVTTKTQILLHQQGYTRSTAADFLG